MAYYDIHDINSLYHDKLQDMVEKLCMNKVVRLFSQIFIPNDNQGMRLVYEDSRLQIMIKLVLDIREYLYVFVEHEESVNKLVIERPETRIIVKRILEK